MSQEWSEKIINGLISIPFGIVASIIATILYNRFANTNRRRQQTARQKAGSPAFRLDYRQILASGAVLGAIFGAVTYYQSSSWAFSRSSYDSVTHVAVLAGMIFITAGISAFWAVLLLALWPRGTVVGVISFSLVLLGLWALTSGTSAEGQYSLLDWVWLGLLGGPILILPAASIVMPRDRAESAIQKWS